MLSSNPHNNPARQYHPCHSAGEKAAHKCVTTPKARFKTQWTAWIRRNGRKYFMSLSMPSREDDVTGIIRCRLFPEILMRLQAKPGTEKWLWDNTINREEHNPGIWDLDLCYDLFALWSWTSYLPLRSLASSSYAPSNSLIIQDRIVRLRKIIHKVPITALGIQRALNISSCY